MATEPAVDQQAGKRRTTTTPQRDNAPASESEFDAAPEAHTICLRGRAYTATIAADMSQETDMSLWPPFAAVRWAYHRLRPDDGHGPLPVSGFGALPFHVGRLPERHEAPPRRAVDLELRDHQPFQLSRLHFVIEEVPDGVQVRDLGSSTGCVVNGIGIGNAFAARSALLRMGANLMLAGNDRSPFRFTITVAVV